MVDGLALPRDDADLRPRRRLGDKEARNLDRHWRNARTSSRPTTRLLYKAQAIGDHELNGAPLPPNWFF